jgi:hypothetical protein
MRGCTCESSCGEHRNCDYCRGVYSYSITPVYTKRKKKKVKRPSTGFQKILRFFNSKKSNKIFTRAEYFMALKDAGLRPSTMDTVRCYLQNAEYLSSEESGVYRKLRPIPQTLTYTKLYKEAYPK